MSRRARLHVSGGFYYVSQRCGPEQRLFSTPEDYVKFSDFLGRALKQLKMRVHAYCWLPSEFHLLVEVGQFPVGKLVKRLANHLTRRIQDTNSVPTLFPRRHRSVLIDHEEYLLRAIRYIHWRSVTPEMRGKLNGYEWSSHLGYLGVRQVPWLTTYVALGQFNRHTERARRGYAVFASIPPANDELHLFDPPPGGDPRLLGGSFFVRRLGLGLQIPANMTLEALTKTIARRMGLEPEQICSRSQRGQLPLARAAIAWHAKERKIATPAGVARFFGFSRSSLHIVIANNRTAHPEWFDVWKLPGVGAIAPTSLAMTVSDVTQPIDSDEPNIESERDEWAPRKSRQLPNGLAQAH